MIDKGIQLNIYDAFKLMKHVESFVFWENLNYQPTVAWHL